MARPRNIVPRKQISLRLEADCAAELDRYAREVSAAAGPAGETGPIKAARLVLEAWARERRAARKGLAPAPETGRARDEEE